MNSHSHTPVPQSLQRLTFQAFLLFEFSVSKPKRPLWQWRKVADLISCVTMPFQQHDTQELTGGTGKRRNRKREKWKEKGREKNAQIFKMQNKKTMRQHSEHISPLIEVSLQTDSLQSCRGSHNHSCRGFLHDLTQKVSKVSKVC